jgi:hypothetical protein
MVDSGQATTRSWRTVNEGTTTRILVLRWQSRIVVNARIVATRES